MYSAPSIHFHFLVPASLKHRKQLKEFIASLFVLENIALDTLNYIFCTDVYLHTLNLKYLRHDTLTDIVTFQLSDKGAPVISDIYISTDRVAQNALELGKSKNNELHRVIFHGALHLCNYDDKSKKSKAAMRQREDFYLEKYFVPRGTI